MKQSNSTAMRFFSIAGHLIVIFQRVIALIVILVFLVALWWIITGGPTPEVPDNVALVWAPSGDLVEESHDLAYVKTLFTNEIRTQSVVRDLIETLDNAAKDSRISVVVLKLDDLSATTQGQLADLAEAIRHFRKSGKPVIAYASSYDQNQYYLASEASDIYMDPMGSVLLQGFSAYHLYFKDALDKLGVNIHVFQAGKYKSAVEPFIRNDMSPAARTADRAWLDSLWGTYKQDIANNRAALSSVDVDQYIEHFADRVQAEDGDAAKVAQQAHLVDALLTTQQLRANLEKIVGTDANTGSFRQINDIDYLAASKRRFRPPADSRYIGFITVEGAIVDGESGSDYAGGDTIVREFEKVRNDKNMAAVVLRINSPGGGIHASEIIRREVQQTRESGIPVVVSMSGVAASGGYWIAMNANQILAHASTITGSIGVFGLIPNFTKPLEKLGIHNDGIGTTPLSGALRPDRPLQPEMKTYISASVEHSYQTFIHNVSAARGLDIGDVENLAQGRVWSGADAKRLGLVDKIGGLQDAFDSAALLVGIQPGHYQVEPVTATPEWGLSKIRKLFSQVSLTALPFEWRHWLTAHSEEYEWLTYGLNDPHGLYAYCPCMK